MFAMTSTPRSLQFAGKVSRPRLVAVVGGDCTGCNTCVDYCLVDCIEPTSPGSDLRPPTPVHIREDECIGCSLCAKVCDEIRHSAIQLVPVGRPLPSTHTR
jgi:Pyruvate/2-oxoacid:ferredoxin oxidoreductase delta subunit